MSLRILILDTGSNAVDWALRCQQYGHEVKYWDRPRDNGTERRAGEGFIEKVKDFNDVQKRLIHWADLIYLADNARYLDLLAPYFKLGYPIFAGTAEAADLELNRGKGQDAMKKAGIAIMESRTFTDYGEAAKFVQKHPEFLVSKPSGDADKALSYVADDPGDMTYMLERWAKRPDLVKLAKRDGFILQEKKYGVEMAVGGFFGPGGWSQWFVENFEMKKLMVGDLGVATGEMGTVVSMVKRSALAEKVLLPMTEQLHDLGYVGYIDNNCIIDDEGNPWPMEFTVRDGWPLKHNLTSLIQNDDPAQWMLDLIDGKDTIEAEDGLVSVSVVVALPDFPYGKFTNKDVSGVPIYDANDMEHIHFSEVMMGEAPVWIDGKVIRMPCPVTCGDYPMVVTGTGRTIMDARKDAYAAVKKIRMPNSPFYRTDIGMGRLVKQLPKVKRLGYARSFKFE